MKPNLLLRWMAVGVSSLASFFTAHALHAKPLETKDISKNSKKARSTETRGSIALDTSWLATTSEMLRIPGHGAHQYPWKFGIVTTTFWIGERPTENNPVPNHKSCWDARWAANYGGSDTPNRRERTSQFIPAKFTPRQNPFYVALPYNDMTTKGHKPEAARIIPWFQSAFESPNKSVCKGRWIAIRKGDRVCYAQWEDAGPFRTDHWEYVFGNERPRSNLNKGAGLDVSPAVRDFLGMEDTDLTDWKFVEFEDVPLGPWATYGNNNTFVLNRRAQQERLVSARSRGRPAEISVPD